MAIMVTVDMAMVMVMEEAIMKLKGQDTPKRIFTLGILKNLFKRK